MNPILRNVIAVVAGIAVGMSINMLIITISGYVIPLPEGADVSTDEGLIASMPLFQPKHFIMPFLAHALGTFSGTFLAAAIAVSHKMRIALVLGLVFMIGGIAAVFMLPAPLWFEIVDLVGAYIPMAYLAGLLAVKLNPVK